MRARQAAPSGSLGTNGDSVTRSAACGVTPPRNCATSSSGRTVADSPMRCSVRPVSVSSRSSDSARCAPRLVGASAWISSTMTVSTLAQRVACARRQQQVQRFRRRDQDVGGLALEARALGGRRVARANRDVRHDERVAARGGDADDSCNGRAQVPLDVDGQRLERRDVEHAAARGRIRHAARTSADRCRPETPPASCRCRSARGSAWTRRAQWRASRPTGRRRRAKRLSEPRLDGRVERHRSILAASGPPDTV